MWPFSKKETKPVEIKSASFDSFINHLFDNGNSDLGAYLAIDLYSKVGPLATAINIITDSLAQLNPVLIKDEEVIKEHDVLTLLANPNQDQTKAEFLKRFSSLFLISGDNFTIAHGQVNKPPIALWIPSPNTATVTSDKTGFAGKIDINQGEGSFNFIRDDKWRYYDGPLREVWHTKSFNPHSGALFGQSVLTPIFYDIEQYKEASTHNLSLLKRGARPSGVFLANERLQDDQFERLKAQIDNYYTGSNQAGRPVLVDGEGMDYKDMMQTARDMDFLKLKENVTTAIFNQLKIPLPLIAPDNQSYANMQAANLQLFTNAVLPLADRIFEELSLFLLPRFGVGDMKLSYDRATIGALDLKTAESLELRSKANIYTRNELRAMDGAEPLAVGGDEIVGTGAKTAEQVPEKPTKQRFLELMDGKGLDKKELEAIAKSHGLN